MLKTKNFTIKYLGEFFNEDKPEFCWDEFAINFKSFKCSTVIVEVENNEIISIFVEDQKGRSSEEVQRDYNLFSLVENDVLECIMFMNKFQVGLEVED